MPVVDVGTVQDVVLLEVNSGIGPRDPAFCRSVLPAKSSTAPCSAVTRTYRLKDSWRERALTLVNTHPMTAGAKCPGPRQVLLIETTRGKRAFEWNFECKQASASSTRAWAEFFTSFGIVQHMPARR